MKNFLIVVLIIIIGILGYKQFGPENNIIISNTENKGEETKEIQEVEKNEEILREENQEEEKISGKEENKTKEIVEYQNLPVKSERTFIVEVSREEKECQRKDGKKCLQIKEEGKDWQIFYNTIHGFEYNEGDYYVLKIKETIYDQKVENTNNVVWELVEIQKQISPIIKN